MRLPEVFIFLKKGKFLFYLPLFVFLASCGADYSPKPEGYFRIDFPDRDYTVYENDCPFIFEYPSFATISYETGESAEPCWLNIDFPGYKGRLHLSYKEVEGDINVFIEDARKMAYKHTVKAEAIDESMFFDHDKNVYGVLYDIKGEVASSVQFFVTDSTDHFLRGALYFNVQPNKDSLAPVIDYFREDIVNLMETISFEYD